MNSVIPGPPARALCPALALFGALALLGVAGCAAPSRPRPSAAVVSSCRSSTETAFNRQNRDLLSYRDSTDTPFSTSFDSGITSAGLSRRFERDQMMSSCVNTSGSDVGDGNGPPSAGGTTSSFSRDIGRTPAVNGP